MFSHVAIVGVGLIGGSLGLGLKKAYPRLRIFGYDKRPILKKAERIGTIDVACSTLEQALRDADLIILATPVDSIMEIIPEVARLVPGNVVVTDVGSVKTNIVRLARKHFRKGNFIGGHPVAGSERAGLEAASPTLFRDRPYVLTPWDRDQKKPVSKLSEFLAPLGARISVLEPELHDELLAAMSHLPQLASVALMNTVGGRSPKAKGRLDLVGTGFLDATRTAESSFEIWSGILQQNRRNIIKALDLYLDEMYQFRLALSKGGDAVGKKFDSARRLRRGLSKR